MADRVHDNNMRGVLFREKEKRSDNAPDYSGSCEIEGKQYWLDGWKRMSANGNPFLSLRLKLKQARNSIPPKAAEPPKPPAPPQTDDWGDEIPF